MQVACEAVNGWYEIQNAIIVPRENPDADAPDIDALMSSICPYMRFSCRCKKKKGTMLTGDI